MPNTRDLQFLVFAFSLLVIATQVMPRIDVFVPGAKSHQQKISERKKGRLPLRDRMDLAVEQEIELTRDPATGTVPRERLVSALAYAEALRQQAVNGRMAGAIPGLNWTERGPNNVGGRTRAIMVDPNDPSYKTVWAAGVGGGIWKTNDIFAAEPVWTPVNDLFDNIAVTCIAFNPLNKQEMYFGTGEGYYNGDAIRGSGIWKTTNGGTTWSSLSSTLNVGNFRYVQRIAVHPVTGAVYAATRNGLFRSTNGGTSWSKVLGNGTGAASDAIADLEIASDNSIYAAIGIFSLDGIYKSSSGDAGSWTKLNTGANGFPTTGFNRIEIAAAPSNSQVIYAVTHNSSTNGVGGIYQSVNGGTNWTQRTNPVDADGGIGNDFTRGQAWYDLSMAVDPNNSNTLFIGGIDLFKSTNGGSSWQQISHWYGGFGFQEVHADQHTVVFQPGSSDIIYFGNDGGVFQTINGTASIPVIVPKISSYNVTQFYACAMNPTAYSSQFLAGAQDNGSQQFAQPGINSTVEVTGGDGCYNHIDQDQPQFQFTSYVYNNYYRSTNGGATFGGLGGGSNTGYFVNPTDYDDLNNNLYVSHNGGQYGRILNIPASNAMTTVPISDFGTGRVTHVSVSPNTSNRVFFGLSNGRIVRVDNAHSATPTSANITGTGMPTGSVSCIAIENGNDNHLLVTYTNYGVNSAWETTNGGSSWTSVEGNLPDMPVRWALFNPNNSQQALLATEIGVWSTDMLSGTSTNWAPSNNGLANVKTNMLQIRTSDKLIIAATHGRGLYSSDVFTDPYPEFTANRKIAYTGKSITFTDASYKSSSWYWDFGDGTTSTAKNPVKVFNNPGLYTITLQINGNSSLQRVKTGFIHILPNKGVPYMLGDGGDFDANPLQFGSENISGTAFERGNSAIAGKNGTRSGSSAWVTGLTASNYANNSDARLWTPNFNMTIPGTYTLRFYRKNVFEIGWDGMRVEYTLDRGDTWLPLGIVTANWYDFSNTAGSTSFPVNQPYFNATRSSYTLATYDVTSLSGNSSVGFRIRFKSDVSVTAAGLAIDDFELTGPTNTPLPVELASFTGVAKDNYNELKWTTLSEKNNDRFEIERSISGFDFTQIGVVRGHGNSNNPVHYRFDDRNIEPRNYYYRLKQVDVDGRSDYSGLVLIKRNAGQEGFVDFLFPNPAREQLHILFKTSPKEKISVDIFDLSGRKVKSGIFEPDGIKLTITFSDTEMPAGSYLIRVKSPSAQSVHKFVRNNN
jgi:PKD repeat protein